MEAPSTDFYGTPTLPESGGTTLFIIDPQVDFHPGGSLAIETADADASRIADMIATHGDKINDIIITLDTHEAMHIAHPGFWVSTATGASPEPFTIITSEDITLGKWTTRNPSHKTWGLKYCQELEKQGRFKLCIWPEHCLIGTRGHNVVDSINDALDKWVKQAEKESRTVHYFIKGNNMLTECYSAFRADVPVESDPRTFYNEKLLARLLRANRVLVCGQAMSHCVNFTVRDMVPRWPKERLRDIFLLEDCQSPVSGFEANAQEFLSFATEAGISVIDSKSLSWK